MTFALPVANDISLISFRSGDVTASLPHDARL
jgi:hypothetical protein